MTNVHDHGKWKLGLEHVRRADVGKEGERIAEQYLRNKHCRIVDTNWRMNSGEIDIVAVDEGTLVFVEVRTRRRNSAFGSAAESVDVRKQQKVRRLAETYLHLNRMTDVSVRFDVIAVEYDNNRDVYIHHIQAAF